MLSKEIIEDIMKEPPKPIFTEEEEAYRRGYSQGFEAALRRPDVTLNDVYCWRFSCAETAPPGSYFENQYLSGLTKDDPHRFFLNRLKCDKDC